MSYHSSHIYLTEGQQKKLMRAVHNRAPVSLKITYKQLLVKDNLTPIKLTATQIKKIQSSTMAGVGLVLKISAKQIAANKKEGGFLPFLIPLLASAATTIVSGIAGAAASYGTKKAIEGVEGAVKKAKKKREAQAEIIAEQAMERGQDVGMGLMPLGVGLFPHGVRS